MQVMIHLAASMARIIPIKIQTSYAIHTNKNCLLFYIRELLHYVAMVDKKSIHSMIYHSQHQSNALHGITYISLPVVDCLVSLLLLKLFLTLEWMLGLYSFSKVFFI